MGAEHGDEVNCSNEHCSGKPSACYKQRYRVTASIVALLQERPLAGMLGLIGIVLAKAHNRVPPDALALLKAWSFVRRNGGRFLRSRSGYWEADIDVEGCLLKMLLRAHSSDIHG